MMDKIFIVNYSYNDDWIMGKIASDIQRELEKFGYQCRRGELEDYHGEEICYHIAYHLAVPIRAAKHNSVFYTHLNDELQEFHIQTIKDSFDSFICMSQEDAEFLIELGFDSKKVYGKTLPIRNTYIRPISVGIFSACYSDGRKNEQWLLDYCKIQKDAKLLNFVFVGKGWGKILPELESLDCSFEWHNVSRNLPYEYQFQQNKLSNLNYYFYMGMDGGAMGTYDAYAQDVPLCVTYDGFHKSIPNLDYCFDDKQSFFEQMDKIVLLQKQRIVFFEENTSEKYVAWILRVWKGEEDFSISESEKKCITYTTVLEKKRDQYYKVNYSKIISYLKRVYWRYKKQKSINK